MFTCLLNSVACHGSTPSHAPRQARGPHGHGHGEPGREPLMIVIQPSTAWVSQNETVRAVTIETVRGPVSHREGAGPVESRTTSA